MKNPIQQYTEAGRYVRLLRACAGNAWPDVKDEIVSIGAFIKNRQDYARWAERSHDRWWSLIQACQQPLVGKLMRFLLKQRRVTFAAEIADTIAHDDAGICVSYAKQAPSDEAIQKLVQTLWGGDADKTAVCMAQQCDLIEGVRVTCGHQTYDMSYRHYRHHLITSLRSEGIE